VAYWDFTFSDPSREERDSSASSIAACALLQLATQVQSDTEQKKYQSAALTMLDSLVLNYSTAHHPESNALLLHGVQSKPGGRGIDEASLWGDYFFLEALVRATRPSWRMYW
jgi:unsaturated chondroitin disaccharide hydrolase